MRQDGGSATKTKLMDEAAALVQTRGYHGFSFYDLAERVGIKTASIHYHFPTKAALGQALVKRYTEAFMAGLGSPAIGTPEERLLHYASLFRAALLVGRMCLCGMIGVEISGVPGEVAAEVREFFELNRAWLKAVLRRSELAEKEAQARAELFLGALEGGLLVARVSGDNAAFDRTVQAALSSIRRG
jgi:TetR/AcrR family transcriptional regulator, transcriptional repressor for nem operon